MSESLPQGTVTLLLADVEGSTRLWDTQLDAMTAAVARLGNPDYPQHLDHAETQIDNLRAAFAWNRDTGETEVALGLASSLLPVWMTRACIHEGRSWFDTILGDPDADRLEVSPAVRARALADKAVLDIFVDAAAGMTQAESALTIARELDDPSLLARALTAYGMTAIVVARPEAAAPYFAEAIDLARDLNDRWRLVQILTFHAAEAVVAGYPVAARTAAEEGCELANAIGSQSDSLWCRWGLGFAHLMLGDLAEAAARFREVIDEAQVAQEVLHKANCLQGLAFALAFRGELSAARTAADQALESAELGEYFAGMGYSALTTVALAAGDIETAKHAGEAAWQNLNLAMPQSATAQRTANAQVALAAGDLDVARRWCDEAVQSMTGRHLMSALVTRARIAILEGKHDEAERDARHALSRAADTGAYLDVPDVLESLATLAGRQLPGSGPAFRRGGRNSPANRLGSLRSSSSGL